MDWGSFSRVWALRGSSERSERVISLSRGISSESRWVLAFSIGVTSLGSELVDPKSVGLGEFSWLRSD